MTDAQRATLSNTICGDAQAARELEDIMGLRTIRRIEPRGQDMIAFFALTKAADGFGGRHLRRRGFYFFLLASEGR